MRSQGLGRRKSSLHLRPALALGKGRVAHVPDQAHTGQQSDEVVTDVDLPPVEALVGAALVVVVVVVPTFAKRDQRQEEVVAAVVGSGVTAPPDEVAEGVN